MIEHVLEAHGEKVRLNLPISIILGRRLRRAAPIPVLILVVIVYKKPGAVGNIELVPTSKTLHPQAQAGPVLGTSAAASKPHVILVIELKFLSFIFKS
jgi:hypothetical protein